MGEHSDTSLTERLLAYLRNELLDPLVDYRSPLTPLKGGYTTALYRFQLQNVSEELSKPLVLRLYPPLVHAGRADFEGVVQNALATTGYPVPRVFFISMDRTILGGEFIIMAFMLGEMKLASRMSHKKVY
jgi:aminoglycoside phosphotransferase (APT) family kinase protein